MKAKFKNIIGCLAVFCCFFSNAQERIIRFDTKIQIEHSGKIQITENITIKAEGIDFEHGLLRVLPLTRPDKEGNKIEVRYDIQSVKKDGREEDYFTKESNGFWKIYIGDKNVQLQEGIYTYQIIYSSPYQIGYFASFDELYWNATGTDWDFPIDLATCEIYLPQNKQQFKNIYSYSGRSGTTTSRVMNDLVNNNSVARFAVHDLGSHEGMTVAVSFAKGIVLPPSTLVKSASFYKEIKEELWSVIFGIGTVFFCFYLRLRKRDNTLIKTIIPEFRPPYEWSPALVGYVYQNGVEDKVYMASVVQTAIKGVIKITSSIQKDTFTSSKIYEIEVLDKSPKSLTDEEENFFKPIAKRKKLLVSKAYYRIFERAYNGWYTSVKHQLKLKDYHVSTTLEKWIGFVLMANIGLFFLMLSNTSGIINYSFFFFLISGSVTVTLWLRRELKDWRFQLLRGFFCFSLIVPTLFIYIGSLFMSSFLKLFIQAILLLGYIFYRFSLGKYTTKGAEVIQRIEGFKRYLETAEKNRMNMLNPPEQTPELFEELLPYAIALDVDVAWGNQFGTVLELAKYDPVWYAGEEEFYTSPTLFVSSLNKGFAASKIDPTPSKGSSSNSSSGSSGSWSSGSSGGGSSGGGGGGGW
ncbi:DUF2207 domain-containing protein [Flavobacterium sp. 7A]|uniref:DUF2207 domain-containing protein n=1 Tax=Flavobacterium sp. 7A TaxID=2940571 RepID=UPI0022262611|nr:DUF2207 domain-containing protein [Flavobacterium sp. 7A]MCW2120234.1 putative membrane protein YgcG [Flavobacterium sp. 7A]